MLLHEFNTILNNAVVLNNKLNTLIKKGIPEADKLKSDLTRLLNKEAVTDNINNIHDFMKSNQDKIYEIYDEYIRTRYEDK